MTPPREAKIFAHRLPNDGAAAVQNPLHYRRVTLWCEAIERTTAVAHGQASHADIVLHPYPNAGQRPAGGPRNLTSPRPSTVRVLRVSRRAASTPRVLEWRDGL